MSLFKGNPKQTINAGHPEMGARSVVGHEKPETNPIGAIIFKRGFDIDKLLVDISRKAAKTGILVGGLVQETCGGIGGCAQSVQVVDIRSGEKFNIWEDRGPCARGCRLNEHGLSISEKILDQAIRDKVDLLIINRFGRAESLGRGLVGSFVQAMEANIPLLTSVREPYVEAWHEFHGCLADNLQSNRTQIENWVNNSMLTGPKEEITNNT